MKKTETLKKNYEFSRVYRKGKYYTGKYITLYALPNRVNMMRLGITVSRKAFKSSVTRNRIRRLIKENYRIFESSIIKNMDIVFVVRKTNNIPEFKDINKEMKYLLNLSGLFKGETPE